MIYIASAYSMLVRERELELNSVKKSTPSSLRAQPMQRRERLAVIILIENETIQFMTVRTKRQIKQYYNDYHKIM